MSQPSAIFSISLRVLSSASISFGWGGSPYRDGPRAADASIKIFASPVSTKVAIDRTPRESDATSFTFIFPDIIHHNNNRSTQGSRIMGGRSSGILPRKPPPRQIFFHRHCCLLLSLSCPLFLQVPRP